MSRNAISSVERHSHERRVLIADDSPAGLDLRRFLAERGHCVRSATRGPEAIELAHQFRPSVVLLDLNTPDLDGWEVCRELRADDTATDIAIIALMDPRAAGFAERCRSVSFDAYLLKPVELQLADRLVTCCPG